MVRRLLGVTAAALSLLAGTACGTSRSATLVPSETTITIATTPAVTSAVPSSMDPPSDWSAVEVTTDYDQIGSMHTVVPNAQPITATITPIGDSWCTGGHGEADVTLTNTGVGMEHVQSPMLVLHGGAAKWTLETAASVDIQPGATATFHASFTVPAVNPGDYGLIVYGFDSSSTVVIDGPTLCTGADIEGTGVAASDGAMSNYLTEVTFTNVGDRRCLLAQPEWIEGVGSDGAAVPLSSSRGTYFGDPPLRRDHVLAPGDSELLYLGTGTGCLDDAHPASPLPSIRIHLAWPSIEFVDVAVPLETTCGVGISELGQPSSG